MSEKTLFEFFHRFGKDKVSGRFHGFFNIPVAVCDGGECISNHESKDRNYPCIVGENLATCWGNDEYMKAQVSDMGLYLGRLMSLMIVTSKPVS